MAIKIETRLTTAAKRAENAEMLRRLKAGGYPLEFPLPLEMQENYGMWIDVPPPGASALKAARSAHRRPPRGGPHRAARN